jgi:DNA-binding HxlR family transcriptional regulator
MGDIIRTRKGLSARVAATGDVEGGVCSISARKSFLLGCSYDVMLEAPGSEMEPRIVASGTFTEALWALKKSADARGCVALLKEASLALGDPEANLTRGMAESKLMILAGLQARRMTLDEMKASLGVPERALAMKLLELKSEGLVTQESENANQARRYGLSNIGAQVCEMLSEDPRFAAAAQRLPKAP